MATLVRSVRDTLARTRRLAAAAVSTRRGAALFALTTVTYLLVYLVAVRDLGRTIGSWTVDVIVVSEPLSRMVQQIGPYQFEPIASIILGPVTYLFSPLNVAIGLGLAALVGVNLAITLYTRRQPAACSTQAPAGAIAGIPALLSGSACCGPLLLIVFGVQATATVLTAFRLLLPAATVLLLASLLYLGWRADEAVLETASAADVSP